MDDASKLNEILSKHGAAPVESAVDANTGSENDNKSDFTKLNDILSKHGASPVAENEISNDQENKSTSYEKRQDPSFSGLLHTAANIVGLPTEENQEHDRQMASRAASLLSGIPQGAADVVHGIAEVPNWEIDRENKKYGEHTPHINIPDMQIPQADWQKEAIAAHPNWNLGGKLAGGAIPGLLVPGGEGVLANTAIQAGLGFLGTDSNKTEDRLTGAALGGTGAAVLGSIGKAAQGIKKSITGSNVDDSLVKSIKSIDMDGQFPHILTTTDAGLKNQFNDEVLPAAGNKVLRDQAQKAAKSFDEKSNEFINGFNATDKEGNSLRSENGIAPSQEDVKKIIVDKINDAHQQNRTESNYKRKEVDNKAEQLGARVNVDGYISKLESIVNHGPTSEGPTPSNSARSFAENELNNLRIKGIAKPADKTAPNENSKEKILESGKRDFLGQFKPLKRDIQGKFLKRHDLEYDISTSASGHKIPTPNFDASGAKYNPKTISFKEATDLDKRINGAIGLNKGGSKDYSLAAEHAGLKSSLNKDIDKSVENTGNDQLVNDWRSYKDMYRTKVVPFREHDILSKYEHPNNGKANSDKILSDIVKSDNPTTIKQITDLVPGIKEDLGFLKLREASQKFNKKNNPDINNMMQSVGNMHDGAGEALFGADKWKKMQHFKKVYGEMKPYLDFGKNPFTGGRVQQANARKTTDDLTKTAATILTANHLAPIAAGTLATRMLGKLGANKFMGKLMAHPESFENAQQKTYLTPKERKVYRSILSGTTLGASNSLVNDKDKK